MAAQLSATRLSDDDARWAAALARDCSADGAFFTCVKTTGVYCLASCPARPLRRNVVFASTRAEAEVLGFRPCKRCRPDRVIAPTIEARLDAIDWVHAGARLDAEGFALLGRVLCDADCEGLAALYDEETGFRSKVVMARHGFGAGAYKYFADPLPSLVRSLRERFYERLAPVAARWRARDFPARHEDYRRVCSAAGQHKPTPLILAYGPGDYNRLHQDLYGSEIFPIQVAILLSSPGRDFTGGEFVLTEQRPRRQSRVHVAPLDKGDAIAFAVAGRPVMGARRNFQAVMRHGVSTIRSGRRMALGVIFHDAA